MPAPAMPGAAPMPAPMGVNPADVAIAAAGFAAKTKDRAERKKERQRRAASGLLSIKDKERIKDTFNQFDEDENGLIDAIELANALNVLGLQMTKGKDVTSRRGVISIAGLRRGRGARSGAHCPVSAR